MGSTSTKKTNMRIELVTLFNALRLCVRVYCYLLDTFFDRFFGRRNFQRNHLQVFAF